MKKKMFLKKITWIIVILYIFITFVTKLYTEPGAGDEYLFRHDLKYIYDFGWIEAIKKGISIPYLILAYPLYLLFEAHIALRLVNILLLILMLFYFKNRKVESDFYLLFLFYLCVAGSFFLGTNDTIFSLGLILFLFEVYQLTLKKDWYPSVALVSIVISIFTRQMIIVYLPIIIFSVYIIFKYGSISIKQLRPSAFLFFFFLLINIPSIFEKNKLSYDDKQPPEGTISNWAQRQYLSQLLVNSGKVENGQHASWQETDEYLLKNGYSSLPDSMGKSIFFDFRLTIKEFFKDFASSMFYGFRQLGLTFLFPFFMIFFLLFKKTKELREYYFPIIFITSICIFCFIIISYVELRWLIPIFTISIVYFTDYVKKISFGKQMIISNYFIIVIISIYGLAKVLPKVYIHLF